MNKLVVLNEVRNEKSKDKLSELNHNKEKNYNKSYINFKEKCNYSDGKDEFVDFKNIFNDEFQNNSYEKRLSEIIERIFSIKNNKLIIQFINSIYNDDLNANTKIQYIKTKENIDNNDNLSILAEDEYRKFEYRIQIQAKDSENIAIIIRKIDLFNNSNIININKKKKEDNIKCSTMGDNDRCMIILSSNVEVPDVYEDKSKIHGENIDSKITIIKSWKYDFSQLYEKNMYLLFPLKTLDFTKRLLSMSEEVFLKGLIRDELFRFFKYMNKYLEKHKETNLITNEDIKELNLIAIDLLNYFIKDIKGTFIDIKKDIEITLKDLVV